MLIPNYTTKEKFIGAVKSSKTITDVLKKLGLPNKQGHYYRKFNETIKKLNINIDHFDRYVNHRHPKNTIPLEDILTENSTYHRYNLKVRLIKNGLLKNKCYICNIEPIWNNKPLSLHIDHINGVNDDNRLENLRLLCPNCHSQTPTFSGKKNKKSYIKTKLCPQCNSPMFRKSSICIKCHNNNMKNKNTKIQWPSTKKLLQMVSKSSYVAVAKQLGVSDNAVRKRIKNYPE